MRSVCGSVQRLHRHTDTYIHRHSSEFRCDTADRSDTPARILAPEEMEDLWCRVSNSSRELPTRWSPDVGTDGFNAGIDAELGVEPLPRDRCMALNGSTQRHLGRPACL